MDSYNARQAAANVPKRGQGIVCSLTEVHSVIHDLLMTKIRSQFDQAFTSDDQFTGRKEYQKDVLTDAVRMQSEKSCLQRALTYQQPAF